MQLKMWLFVVASAAVGGAAHAAAAVKQAELSSAANPPEIMTFADFKRLFSKTYAFRNSSKWPYIPVDVEAEREVTFNKNVEFIRKHNAEADRGLHSFRCGVNEFTDLTEAEFAALHLDAGYMARRVDNKPAATWLAGPSPPGSVDWRAKGAVTPVKNQGTCGSCWSFATTGSLEGAYQIATGSLRVLSEQQLIDCSVPEGNNGCGGGAMVQAFEYIQENGGIDSESDYGYTMSENPCWTAAEKRVVATLDSYASVPTNEAQLEAAVALGPVAVAIEADQAGFQHYASGVFDATCGTKLDHGVLVVGYTADHWIVKNSWGASWGMSGYIEMKRGVGSSGICGIAMDASYPIKNKSTPVPVPPPTPGPKPGLPCQCTASCAGMCKQFGMWCCSGAGGNCDCSSPASCPQCNPNPPKSPYEPCVQSTPGCQCVTINGVPGSQCMPPCNGLGSTCPPVGNAMPTTAQPYCDVCNNGARFPTACALVCTATSTKAPFAQSECPKGSTCKPLSLDKDSCDNGAAWKSNVTFACLKTKNCGVCTAAASYGGLH